jgi:hypothetical protein
MDQTGVATNYFGGKLEDKSGKVQNAVTGRCRKWFPAAESDETEINTTEEQASVVKEVKVLDDCRVKGYIDKHASTSVTDLWELSKVKGPIENHITCENDS